MGKYDGSIILETKIDIDGIKSGTKNIKDAISKTDKSIGNLGTAISNELSKGNIKAAQLISNFKKATQEVEKQTQKVNELKQHLSGLESGDIKFGSKGTEKLKSDFEKVNKSINETQREIEELYLKLEALQQNAFRAPGSGEIIFSAHEQKEFDELNARLNELEPLLASNKQKAKELGQALREASGTETRAEIDKVKGKLAEAEGKLQTLTEKADIARKKAEEGAGNVSKKISGVSDSVGKLSKRFLRVARSALIMSTVYSAFNNLKKSIGSALMSSEEFRKSLYTLQAALWTLVQPIYQALLPALLTLMKYITKGILYVATFIAFLNKSTLKITLKNAEALQKEAESFDKVAESSKRATRQLAEFDDISILQSNTTKNASEMKYTDVSSGFKELENLLDSGDLDDLQKFEDWLNDNSEHIKQLLEVAALTACAVAIYNVITAITALIDKFRGKDSALDTQRGKLSLETVAVTALCTALITLTAKTELFTKALNALKDVFSPMPQATEEAKNGVTAYSEATSAATKSTNEATGAMAGAKNESEELGNSYAAASKKIVDGANSTAAPIENEKRRFGELGTAFSFVGQTVQEKIQEIVPEIISASSATDSLSAATGTAANTELVFAGTAAVANQSSNNLYTGLSLLTTVYHGLPAPIDATTRSINDMCIAIERLNSLTGVAPQSPYVSSIDKANLFENNELLAKVVGNKKEKTANAISREESAQAIINFGKENGLPGVEMLAPLLDVEYEESDYGKALAEHKREETLNYIYQVLAKLFGSTITGAKVGSSLFNFLPAYATGGIAPRASVGIIGEAGREAILPLENNTEWMDMLADRIATRNGTQIVKEEHYYLNQTELMKLMYKLAKGGERLNGTSLVKQGGM